MAKQLTTNPAATVATDAFTGQQAVDTAITLFNAFDPGQPIGNVAGNLPHWRQRGVTCFVTFRTADSMPRDKRDLWLRERADWLKRNREPHSAEQRCEYWERYPAQIQYWLDQGHGECLLGHSEVQSIVQSALSHVHRQRYELRDEVVMPNHVHVIVTPTGQHSLSSIVQSWKSFTSHAINKALSRTGTFWQKEFDRIVRSVEALETFKKYIDANRRSRRYLRSRDFVT
jgi:putative transposase